LAREERIRKLEEARNGNDDELVDDPRHDAQRLQPCDSTQKRNKRQNTIIINRKVVRNSPGLAEGE